MPLYIRGGVGPLRYSHRVGGQRKSSQTSGLGCFFWLAVLLVALIIGAFHVSVALGVVAAVFLGALALLSLWAAIIGKK